jgi:phosphatidate cytidylyltransferase
LGRHKLSPAISPGKTIEGAIGGLVANLVIGAIGKFFFLPGLPWGTALLFFITVGIAGQVGDLFESELKRSSNIKDSSGILPGHGGILDRIDALLFASLLNKHVELKMRHGCRIANDKINIEYRTRNIEYRSMESLRSVLII